MNEVQSYPYKCTYCGRSGKYKARLMGIAMDYKCPHDGHDLVVQSPSTATAETFSTGARATEPTQEEFATKLSPAIINKLEKAGTRL